MIGDEAAADAVQRMRETITLLLAGERDEAWQTIEDAASPFLLAVSLAVNLRGFVEVCARQCGIDAAEWWRQYATEHAHRVGD